MSKETMTCKYKLYIDCIKKDRCNKCGWNPEVEERRKKSLRNKEKKMEKRKDNKWRVGGKKNRGIKDEEK